MSLGPGRYTHLAANTNTIVSPNTCTLNTVVINKLGASANVITIYDGIDTTGNIIGIIDSTVTGRDTLIYNVLCSVGIYVVISTGTAADITVSWS